MQNWFIAALESAGIWTHEQAEHVSREIRNHIHKENYSEAVVELTTILKKHENAELPVIEQLQNKVVDLEAEIARLKRPVIPEITVAKTKKV